MVDSTGVRPTVVWFRDDLRLADNPALVAASRRGGPVVLLHVHDEQSIGIRPLGSAARWWLHHSLASLSADLEPLGQRLLLTQGYAVDVVPAVARAVSAGAVVWNRRYGAAATVDAAVAAALTESRIAVETFEASLLYAPEAIRTGSGRAFWVFSAFWRAAQGRSDPRRPLPAPARLPAMNTTVGSDSLGSLRLLPTGHDWTAGAGAAWQPGERRALARLGAFVSRSDAYGEARYRPAAAATSMLSPHLRFGEISPHQVWDATAGMASESRTKFRSELGWREFAWHLLADRPDLAVNNLRPTFDAFPWGDTFAQDVWAWRRGRTGYPIVDAGMRQLWQTGWMHNRVRMIAASFLVKHLLADWRIGEEWFWDTLMDADPASNPVNWQWIAGSGADAQPFFRIVNPVLQGEKFDPDGAYVRRYVPELKAMPDRFIHKPWRAPGKVLADAGVRLGETYPGPIVDHATARRQALAAFASMRQPT